jgi:hypothetical protein
VLAQVRLGGEREADQVGERPAVVGAYAGLVERLPVEGHVLVRVPQRRPQPLQLERLQAVRVEPFPRVQQIRRIRHTTSPSPTAPSRATDHSVEFRDQ